jgi:hypothetical protein
MCLSIRPQQCVEKMEVKLHTFYTCAIVRGAIYATASLQLRKDKSRIEPAASHFSVCTIQAVIRNVTIGRKYFGNKYSKM